MWKVAGHDQRSVAEVYKTTLHSLLSMFKASVCDGSASEGPDSLVFEDFQRLLDQSVFALQILRPSAYEMLWSERDNRTPETGFWRLAGECCKFLSRLHPKINAIGLNEGRPRTQLTTDINKAPNGLISEHLISELDVSCIGKRVALPENDATLTYISDVIKGSGDSVKEGVRKDASELCPRYIVPNDLFEASKCLAGLITLTESQSFESLLTSVCFKRSRRTKGDLGLVILESILATNGLQDPDKTDFRNMSLAFGETPLVLAVRAREPHVVMVLLRHGADVNRGWMGLKNALQVLLFSPNQILLGSQDIAAIEKCLSALLMVMPTIDIEALLAHEREGYYALHPDWKSALRSAMEDSWRTDSTPVPSLQHLCRCTVRTRMAHLGHRILEGLHQLPLPVQLKQFVQLVE